MKCIIASDIHGSAFWCKKLMGTIENESPDLVVLLGDLLYHGPRNPLPDGYAPAEVANMLNSIADSIVAVRGNCDSEVDQMVLDFPCLAPHAHIIDEATRLFCTHGHDITPDDPCPLPAGTLFLSGHTHVKTDEVREGIRFVNPGSIALPKDGSRSFALLEAGEILLRELT